MIVHSPIADCASAHDRGDNRAPGIQDTACRSKAGECCAKAQYWVYLGGVSHNGNLHDTQTTLLAWRLDPGQMCLLSVTGGCNQLAVQLLKLRGSLTEGNNLCWADKCEVLEAKAIGVNCGSSNSSSFILVQKSTTGCRRPAGANYLRIEEKNDILSLVVLKGDLTDLTIYHSCSIQSQRSNWNQLAAFS